MKNFNNIPNKVLESMIADIWKCLRADCGSSILDLVARLVELERELSGRFNE